MSDTIRILLVDDHPLVRDGLRARLEAVAHFDVVAEAGAPTRRWPRRGCTRWTWY